MKIQTGTVSREELGTRMKSFGDFEKIKSSAFFNRIIDNSGTLQESFLQADVLIEGAVQHFRE